MPKYDYSWNSAVNAIISSLEGYLGFCSINPVLGHFHIYYELLKGYINIGCQQKPSSTISEVNINISFHTKWYIVANGWNCAEK